MCCAFLRRVHAVALAFHADSAFPNAAILVGWKNVAVVAVRAPHPLGALAVAAVVVLTGGHKPEVCGVNASPIVAGEMVQLRDVPPKAPRYWFDQPCIHESVHGAADISHTGCAVSGAIVSPGPFPATRNRVNGDLGKDAADVLSVEMRDGEVGLVSHASESFSDVWLEPFGVWQRPGGSLYFTAGLAV